MSEDSDPENYAGVVLTIVEKKALSVTKSEEELSEEKLKHLPAS